MSKTHSSGDLPRFGLPDRWDAFSRDFSTVSARLFQIAFHLVPSGRARIKTYLSAEAVLACFLVFPAKHGARALDPCGAHCSLRLAGGAAGSGGVYGVEYGY